ncbi:hypothetical protein OUZ56_015251, partial [Daphnia magna]
MDGYVTYAYLVKSMTNVGLGKQIFIHDIVSAMLSLYFSEYGHQFTRANPAKPYAETRRQSDAWATFFVMSSESSNTYFPNF